MCRKRSSPLRNLLSAPGSVVAYKIVESPDSSKNNKGLLLQILYAEYIGYFSVNLSTPYQILAIGFMYLAP